ncbi:hypothetical protein POUND7_015048 [Theobroma cacao]
MGGPSWTVKLGKRDSTTASISLVTSQLPHFIANLESLIDLFENKGLSPRDMVTLSGYTTMQVTSMPDLLAHASIVVRPLLVMAMEILQHSI